MLEYANSYSSLCHTARSKRFFRRCVPGASDVLPDYLIYGVVVSEVEVDVLTGEMYVVRADLVEDTGTSISPMVDIGQVNANNYVTHSL